MAQSVILSGGCRSRRISRGPPRVKAMGHKYYVYIMSSKSGVLYIGATNDLERRIFEHKNGLIEGFTKKYRVTRLVYVEEFDGPSDMVARERQLKGWTRARKLDLIHMQNPAMVDYARRTARDPSTPAASAQDDGKKPATMKEKSHV